MLSFHSPAPHDELVVPVGLPQVQQRMVLLDHLPANVHPQGQSLLCCCFYSSRVDFQGKAMLHQLHQVDQQSNAGSFLHTVLPTNLLQVVGKDGQQGEQLTGSGVELAFLSEECGHIDQVVQPAICSSTK